MTTDQRTTIQIIGAIVLAAFLIAGTVIGWPELFRGVISLFRDQPTIDVRSVDRPFATDFFADEKLTFSLSGKDSDNVVWLFEEQEPLVGEVEIEYVFDHDSLLSATMQVYRVDAFFKDGDTYGTVSEKVRVRNLALASVVPIEGRDALLISAEAEAFNFELVGARVVEFQEGRFGPVAGVPLSVTQLGDATTGVIEGELVESEWPRWVALEYRSQSPGLEGQSFEIVKRLTSTASPRGAGGT